MQTEETRRNASTMEDIMTADEVATFLRVDRKTVYNAAARGKLPHRRLGKRLLFSRQALQEWLTGGLREVRR